MDGTDGVLSSIFQGAAITLVGKFLGAVIGFLGTIAITNFLGASVFGGFSYATSVLTIAVMFSAFGLTTGVTRFMSRERGASYFTAGVGITGGLSLIIGTGLFFLAPVIAEVAFEPGATPYIQGAAVAVPFLTLGNIAIAAARGRMFALPGTLFPDIIQPIVKFVGVGIIVVLGAGTVAVASIIPLMAIASFIGGWAYLSYIGFELNRPTTTEISVIVSFSTPLVFTKGIWFLMNNADTLLVGYYIGQTAVGIYAAAFSLAVLLNLVVNSVGSLFMPNVGTLVDDEDFAEVRRVYMIATQWMVILSTPIAFGLFTFPDLALRVFGPEFPEAQTALVFLTFGFLSHIIAGLNGSALQSLNMTKVLLRNQSAAVAINLVLNILLIPKWGVLGAAVATSISFIVSNLSHSLVLYREVGIIPLDRKTAAVLFVGLLGGVAVGQMAGLSTVAGAVLASVVFGVAWLICCFGFGLITISDVRKYAAS